MPFPGLSLFKESIHNEGRYRTGKGREGGKLTAFPVNLQGYRSFSRLLSWLAEAILQIGDPQFLKYERAIIGKLTAFLSPSLFFRLVLTGYFYGKAVSLLPTMFFLRKDAS